MAAVALKMFSANDLTKHAYRRIGNRFGGQRRRNADLDSYARRGNLLVDIYRRHSPPQPGHEILELGTGWMHWYAVYLRLFFDVRITTLDVWDNRQFFAFKTNFAKLRMRRDGPPAGSAAAALLARLIASESFDDVYRLLGMRHLIVPDGSLAQFREASFSSVFSMHVLEHVHREAVPALLRHIHRALKPGAITVHQIGIDDHLAHYDRGASRKQYVSYPDWLWSAVFENEVQYFNRLQLSDWIDAFKGAGFKLVERVTEATTLEGLRISPSFSRYSREDLACTIATLVLQRC